ncbi:MAG: protein-glutamate O-methyltransferase CheR, partial [Candidatus Sulfotelmatobacter sp.]
IYEQSGIHLSVEKKTMLELRIKRRLKALNLDSFRKYCEYLFTARGEKEEIVHLIDVVSTNKTDFFREPDHFVFLAQKAIPDLLAHKENAGSLLVWSAGCSTGEEPYTLAMVLQEWSLANSALHFKVLATDVSTTVLAKAHRGVFHCDVVRPVPAELRRKYFMRSRDPESKVLRVVPELRQVVEFRRLNFMDADFGLAQKVDVVFCRNVMIYFDRPTQERIVQKLANQLVAGGYAFFGHSESLQQMNVPLRAVAPSAYRKDDDART